MMYSIPQGRDCLETAGIFFIEALAGFKFISTLHFTKFDTAKVFFFPVTTVLMLMNSIANFPWLASFTLENLKAEHVESPNLAFKIKAIGHNKQ